MFYVPSFHPPIKPFFALSSTGSVFGGGSNVFGGKPAFGQTNNNTAASIFGGAASFGQKPAANLWAGGSSAGGFGNAGFGNFFCLC